MVAPPKRSMARWLALGLLFAFALTLRWQYLASAENEAGITGDEAQYGYYALNLVRFGVFSSAPPQNTPPAPDAFRSPGYPLLIAACMSVAGIADIGWYHDLRRVQAVLGALCAVLVVLIGAHWLPWRVALGAGGLTAIWPHAIAMTGYALVETLYAFLLLAFLLASALSLRRRSLVAAAIAGGVGSLVLLVNWVAAPAIAAIGLLTWRRIGGRALAVFCVAALLLPGLWSLREIPSTPGPSGSGDRIAMNLVQGSWPDYHAVWRAAHAERDPQAVARLAEIDAQAAAMSAAPFGTLAEIGRRVMADPLQYAGWYLLEKPWLMWDWSIRIGQGDLEVGKLTISPFAVSPALRAAAAGARAVNPLMAALMAACLVALLFPSARRRLSDADGLPILIAVALVVAGIAAVHLVLQSEPRYGIALRPLQMLLAVSAVLAGWRAVRVAAA